MSSNLFDILYFSLLVIAPLPLAGFLIWNLQRRITNQSHPEGNLSIRFVVILLMVLWLAL